jgi:hypothetical protein
MLDLLAAAEADLPRLLAEGTWHSLAIAYHPPIVDRLWCAWRDCRIYLHRIHPCTADEALFHRHPWPSAMRVHRGTYEMGVGHGAIAARLIASGPMVYEMTDPDAWHYVRPLGGVALTTMITGQPWSRTSDGPSLQPLAPAVIDEMLQLYREIYPASTRAGRSAPA